MKIKLPKSWNDITLKQFIEVCEINEVDMDYLDKEIAILAILANVEQIEIESLSIIEIKEASRSIRFIYSKPELKGIKQYIWLGFNKYKINNDVKSISGGEYIDLTSLTKEPKEINKNLPSILSIFLQPVNYVGFKKSKCYKNGIQTLESRNKTKKDIEKYLMMADVMQMSAFFLNNWNSLIKATQEYTILESKKTAKKINKLVKRGF